MAHAVLHSEEWVQRRFRLTRSTDFKRVRAYGKSFAHPLVVLIALPATDTNAQVGVTAGRALGGAVQRNRAKRLLREAARHLLPTLKKDWQVVLVARQPLLSAGFPEIQAALRTLLKRADLFRMDDDPTLLTTRLP